MSSVMLSEPKHSSRYPARFLAALGMTMSNIHFPE